MSSQHGASKWRSRLVEHPQAIQFAFAVSLMQLAFYQESPLVAGYAGVYLLGVAIWYSAVRGGRGE